MFNLSFPFQIKGRISSVLFAGLLALVMLCAGPSLAVADTGFTGKVTNMSLAPLSGVLVQVLDVNGIEVAEIVTTQADGTYSYYGGLPAGTYRVRFQSVDPNNPASAVFYYNKLYFADSDPLTLTDGVITPGINAVIGAWGQIGGKVTNASGSGISGIQVSICDLNGLTIPNLPTVTTKTDGSYVVGGIVPATGAYKVRFIGNSLFAGQWYSNAALSSAAFPISVNAYQTTFVNAILQAANISGKVSNSSGAGIPNIQVYLYDAGSNPLSSVLSQSDGTYVMSGLAPGSYKVGFLTSLNPAYHNQYYNQKSTRQLADLVTVSAGTPLTINATLGTGIPIITGFSAPASSGTLTVTGISITATEPNGVTGYLLTESSTAPSPGAVGWSPAPPTSYTFASAGAKTLYAWAKGTVGVSASVSRTLTVTNTSTLTLQINGTGSGTVNSNPAGIACASGSTSGCSAGFTGGSVVLYAAPGAGSIFTGWSGTTCSGTGSCSATMDADHAVIATFTLAPLVRIGTTPYQTLQAAYDAASEAAVIQMREGILVGSLIANRALSVTIKGGYLADYSSVADETTIDGQIFLRRGSVKVEKVNSM